MKDPARFKMQRKNWPPQFNSGIVANPGNRKTRVPTKREKPSLEDFLRKLDQKKILSLAVLCAGDSLQVVTRNTTYTFQMLGPRDAVLSTNRKDRPAGPARLRGCTIGRSSSISPDHLFCGGNLEFLFNSTKKIHRTTEISAISWLRRSRNC